MKVFETTEETLQRHFRNVMLVIAGLLLMSLSVLTTGCDHKKSKRKYVEDNYNYRKGDVVYLKPDSTIASISDTRLILEDVGRYEANYKDNSGTLKMIVVDETQIYGKK